MLLPACLQIRAELAEKELTLLQKEQELLDKEQTLLVLKEEVSSSAFIGGSWGARAMTCSRAHLPAQTRTSESNRHTAAATVGRLPQLYWASAATTARRHLLLTCCLLTPLPPPCCVCCCQ